MAEKKFFTIISCGVMALACGLFFVLEKTEIKTLTEPVPQANPTVKTTPVSKPIEPKFDLYSTSLYDLPFSAIVDISNLPPKMKRNVDEILETAQGFYYLISNNEGTNIKIFLQNPISNKSSYIRHNLQFVELITDEAGNIKKNIVSPMYEGEDDEIVSAVDGVFQKDDVWVFDKSVEPYLPLKHKKYNDKGKVIFTEKWDYSSGNELKYQMKNAKNKMISVLKEIVENDSNYRQEHILYDEDGNIKISICINFEGANITRFSYYNSENPTESINIFSEYSDGLKVKENLYDSNYKLLKSILCEYVDGERKVLRVLNEKEEEIKILKG